MYKWNGRKFLNAFQAKEPSKKDQFSRFHKSHYKQAQSAYRAVLWTKRNTYSETFFWECVDNFYSQVWRNEVKPEIDQNFKKYFKDWLKKQEKRNLNITLKKKKIKFFGKYLTLIQIKWIKFLQKREAKKANE